MKSTIVVLGVGLWAACGPSPQSAPAPHAVVASPLPDAGHAASTSAKSEPPIEVAVTFDDLPSRDLFANATRLSVLQRIMSALKSHALGPVPGFVNGSFAPTDVDRAALDAWLEGGNELGNHTYSHADLRTIGLGEYLSDIDKNEPLLEALTRARGRPGSYKTFRYPFLEEGRDLEQRRAIRRHLFAHGYRVAPVTIDFGDWAWNEPYARCLARADAKALDALRSSFLRNGRRFLVWADVTARQIFGRPVRHVLLLHAYVFTAEMVDALLVAYEKMNVKFISLDEALVDPIYRMDPGAAPSLGSTFLEQLVDGQGAPHPPYLMQPLELLEALCR
jgi:peptidoglycan/xylan/chitin deacetylase (PgdA/CDA1 family)